MIKNKMKNINLINKIEHYLSSIVLFNIIYSIMILVYGNGNNTFSLIALSILSILGIVFVIKILKTDDSVVEGEEYKKFYIFKSKDLTKKCYALSFLFEIMFMSCAVFLPSTAYFMLVFIFGVAYIKANIFYINPILLASGYNVFKCKGKYGEGDKIFLTKGVVKYNVVIRHKEACSDIIKIKIL